MTETILTDGLFWLSVACILIAVVGLFYLMWSDIADLIDAWRKDDPV